jgi:hypothetical protein
VDSKKYPLCKAPVICVYTLAHAVGALRAAARRRCRIVLASPPGAGISLGPGWFGGLVAAARAAVPDAECSAILDCGEQAGAALAAIRANIENVAFTGRDDVGRRLADIARRQGVGLISERPEAGIDLINDFFAADVTIEQRCGDFLSQMIA